jgi:5-carboxymethyl-2-hydroxymuconate isomerase
MPQISLEYSANLPGEIASEGLLRALHGILREVGGVRIGNCKSRVLPAARFLVGEGEPGGAFVHLDVQFLAGRSPEVKRALGEALLAALREAYEGSGEGLQITVHLVDIPRAAYFKHPPGTLTPMEEV